MHFASEVYDTMLQWSRRFAAAEILPAQAGIIGRQQLQWSRRFAAAEIDLPMDKEVTLSLLQWSRRFAAAEILHRLDRLRVETQASMEPPLRSGGDWWCDSRATQLFRLLQWSRRFAAAEIRYVAWSCCAICGFNGAAASQRRRY